MYSIPRITTKSSQLPPQHECSIVSQPEDHTRNIHWAIHYINSRLILFGVASSTDHLCRQVSAVQWKYFRHIIRSFVSMLRCLFHLLPRGFIVVFIPIRLTHHLIAVIRIRLHDSYIFGVWTGRTSQLRSVHGLGRTWRMCLIDAMCRHSCLVCDWALVWHVRHLLLLKMRLLLFMKSLLCWSTYEVERWSIISC